MSNYLFTLKRRSNTLFEWLIVNVDIVVKYGYLLLAAGRLALDYLNQLKRKK